VPEAAAERRLHDLEEHIGIIHDACDLTLKMMLKEVVDRQEGDACGSAMSLVRGRVSIGVPGRQGAQDPGTAQAGPGLPSDPPIAGDR
jgi:hypothetical protein